ncbi:hypothetical protein CKO28_04180 [Rhodovibrio sodomensis]|uniref:Sel1 repeat family protein n=1 Tax=Rhodovibrio sodomensis TaxID=1088 RepID=A0ABS1DA51_9PROT|nr:hypothetical protein [Rhodovibrio sodomensis]MBK1667240.1 hypothetical protein [Rhodovibrio sodomensis]
MSIARALPYLLLALVLGAAGYLAGAVTDPFAPTQTRVAGELAPPALQLRRQLEQARGEAADLTGELRRAQATIDRLRADLAETRTRIAELQQRAETAEQARADAQTRIGELAARVAALEARADTDVAQTAEAREPAQTPTQTGDTGTDAAASDAAPDDGDAAQQAPQTAETAEATDTPAPEAADAGPAADAQTTADAQTAADAEPADGAAAAAPATDPAVAGAGPADVDADPRPGPDALSPIDPSTRQANRLVAGVQAYQDADYQAAFSAWLPLARAGYARAQLHLGALFLEGRGTDRSDPLAYAWLTIARDNGSQNAGPLLEQLRQRMSAADLDAAQRLLTRARRTAG